ncbi:helix-turn-helix domain-containing protein [Streptomyces avicenniae]|uniref:helix-turn-helix domain-containing protein n=1 Tax=Streptomyces avicenniae TaxID=500153 RepID=UPI000DA5FD8C|nr:AraC family transcriptional regulator [Streptomyces avicenniae]
MAGFGQRAPGIVDIAMVPHPAVTLLVDLGDGDGLLHDAHGRRERGSVAVGLLPGDLRVSGRTAEGVRCLQIRLSPVVATAVLGASTDLVGTVASLADVWGRDAARTEDRLRAATSWDERFAVAADVLGRRLDARRAPDPEVAAAWRRMRADRGRVRIDGLAREVGWSRKRLWSRFRAQVGLSPKRAAQLVRFDHAAHLLAAGGDGARVAAVSGYTDQSHLHREVRAFTGTTPSAVATAPWLALDDTAWPSYAPRPGARG